MGRHRLASKRRKSPLVLAALLTPAAVCFAVAGDVGPFAAQAEAKAVIGDVAPSRLEIVAAESNLPHSAAGLGVLDSQPAASRYHVRSRFLPAGLASEQGLQVRTILASRAITATFPEIHEIGGVRPDPLPWHPLGLALDVMIPNPASPQGIALGNEIVAYVLKNTNRFGVQDAIWRGVYYTPNGAQASRLGHYDHVHVTTTGGGYPKGGETYLAD
ncbi:hypothetical protein [Mycobacterium montefiorense]|uniref:ARB-07466-like C-terminal domain-containing protein n=1 Tax=Mycobacterium montefiorense TaxID=154654 RepID=A0ABQ0NMS2_9MYCO|nr:hypothetical protein [Mycobacterium montefiorense]GBG38163.1 hypothetical protein MmonteBS_25350 [Mycobacterium montefiorense]GKU33686.1 hypothetical protein NJB14191_10330 [Mycobacterium montefiorense]GKU39458.1 hypothetical protein NJB14192_14510 [Mycobacterium montefiorense]GKU44553.1 hypothetical protein NJB14194_11800 [Mycobacterium montefiorense]GKU51632.1 hypothetical protein NJB14195_28780 [Mycobacterium montefiorense]